MALNITGVVVIDSSSEDESVIVVSSESEDSGVGSVGSRFRMDGAVDETPSVPVFNYRDPSFLRLLFDNSHDLVMLTHAGFVRVLTKVWTSHWRQVGA